MSVVGLADPSTARVVVELQDSSRKSVKLRRLPGLAWHAFSTGPYENMAADSGALIGLPSSLVAFDSDGHELGRTELSWTYPHCQPDSCAYRPTRTGNWVIVRDPIASAQSPGISAALERQAKSVLFADANMRRIISGRQYSLGPLGNWQKCDGGMIGVEVSVFVTYPVAIKGELPYTTYEKGMRSAYLEGHTAFDVGNVRELSVGIDLNRKQVVLIDPTIGDDVAVRSFRQIGKLHPAGGPDTAGCYDEGD
jgi:hypothetical protein